VKKQLPSLKVLGEAAPNPLLLFCSGTAPTNPVPSSGVAVDPPAENRISGGAPAALPVAFPIAAAALPVAFPVAAAALLLQFFPRALAAAPLRADAGPFRD
jgi:hypothetical protein